MPRINRTVPHTGDEEGSNQRFVEALARGLTVIRAFQGQQRYMTLSDIAKIASLPRATVRRILFTLTHLGYVEADGRLFCLTPQVLTLATSFLSSSSLATILQPAVDRICTKLKESSMAGVLDGENFTTVARAIPPHKMSLNMGLGAQLPALNSAIGRALLAGCSDQELERLLAKASPKKVTGFTVVNKAKLKAAIEKVRKDGYSVVEDEVVVGFRSIAVPLKRYDGKTVAALNIGVHSERVPLKTSMQVHLPLLLEEARLISPQLV